MDGRIAQLNSMIIVFGAFLVLVVFSSCIVDLVNSSEGKFFSIFAPKLEWRKVKDYVHRSSEQALQSIKDNKELESGYSKSDLSEYIHIPIFRDEYIVDKAGVENILSRILSGVDSIIEKYRRLILKDGSIVISLSAIPIGWRNFFIAAVLQKSNKRNDFTFIHLKTFSDSKIIARFKLENDKLSIEYFYKIGKISMRDSQEVIPFLNQFLKSRINSEIAIAQAKKKLLLEHAKQSSLYKKTKLMESLDRVINPDKYRTKSATVRKSAPSGSNRYKPSSSVAARRVVKRK